MASLSAHLPGVWGGPEPRRGWAGGWRQVCARGAVLMDQASSLLVGGERCWVPWGWRGGCSSAPSVSQTWGAMVASHRQSTGKGACRTHPALPGHPRDTLNFSKPCSPRGAGAQPCSPSRDAGMLQGGCFSPPPVLRPVGPHGGLGAAPPVLPMPVSQRLRPSPPRHLLLLRRGRKDKTPAKWKPMFAGAAAAQMQTPSGAWGGGRGQEAPAERENGIAGVTNRRGMS